MHGNSYFLEYILVRTDLDTLLMPMLETLYNAPRRTPNHIYMVLIVLLILSQDSSFNASIHKLMLPNVPWYQERRLHQTSLGSLMIIILVRTVKYNLSKLRVRLDAMLPAYFSLFLDIVEFILSNIILLDYDNSLSSGGCPENIISLNSNFFFSFSMSLDVHNTKQA
ncbi:uncharacterized protein LOC131018052 [Salvia miltiorrhiza]|uniref:uncharacterized protein LOC131018052 n=1 Tax=Salvia miltiorrhiza TaxID=226208 RepID=UPI0025ACD87D|nr:uncharacterized protein LOC131018052 [Salvia miltiorrhiza]